MSKAKIPSLNNKMGSVKDLIKNIEKRDIPPEGNKELVIEGDSKGIIEIKHESSSSDPTLHANNSVAAVEENPAESISFENPAESISSTNPAESIINVYENESMNEDELEDVNSESKDSFRIKNFNAKDKINRHDPFAISSMQITNEPVALAASTPSSVYDSSHFSETQNVDDAPSHNNSNFPECKASSTWEDGDLLIETYGYQSNSNDIQPVRQNNVVATELNYSDGATLKETDKLNVLGCIDVETLSEQHTENSSFDDGWKFGDIDGLAKAPSKFSQISPEQMKSRINPFEDPTSTNKKVFDTEYPIRSRSVSFKDKPETIYYSNQKDSVIKNNLNPWKYVCYGLLAATVFIYVITLTFNEFFTSSKKTILLSESDVLQYFEKSSNITRTYLLHSLVEKYNLTVPDHEDTYNNKLEKTRKEKITYSPRENDTDIISISNAFTNINPKYWPDNDIKKLMTDDDLKFMFSGLSYAPEHVIEPQCGATLQNVMLDIARISKVTGRVRTYGTQCKQADLILNSIDELKLNMTLAMGVWIGSNEETNKIQIQEMKDMLKKYPPSLFHSIFIGNEVIYRNDKTVTELMNYIKEVKSYLKSLGMSDIPVGTSEIGSMITPEMFETCDFVGANIHPFFGGIDAQFGTRWVLDYFHNQLLPIQTEAKGKGKMIISEVGWPYQGGEFVKAVAGSWEYQQFLNDWLCTTPASILNDAFFFEAFDEPWKKIWWDKNRTWETEWGFFDSNRKMKKHIYMPDCSKYGNPSAVDFNYIEEVEDPYADGRNVD